MAESNEYIAHVTECDGKYRIHDLEEHLQKVAELASEFAREIGADWAELAGLWHDLGKYRPAFQTYIRHDSGYAPDAHITGEAHRNTSHASVGAVYARTQSGGWGTVLAYLIAGHHTGLPDYEPVPETKGRGLREIVVDDEILLKEALAEAIPDCILQHEPPSTAPLGDANGGHLWIRMLFSCLVDADFLDTECFMSPDKTAKRMHSVRMEELLLCFNRHMATFQANARPTKLNEIRSELLQQARKSAQGPPGIFTMTIPTGGGKTLSSLAFALEHAVKHGKRRIVYAIPYTSIIEQTANIFRDIFEPLGDILVEHHSNTDADQFGKEKSWSRLATENWDAPLIVTTTVQLFESLYAAKTSRCRKLHNLVDSVIVIDETQLLPIEHLNPIRHVIQLLQRYYGVSFVLSTATPTGLDPQKDPFGRQLLKGMHSHEIVHRPKRYYASLKRVEYDLPADFSNVFSWDDIRDRLVQHESVLCVVNTRKDARELFDKMPKGTYHLSALMCAEHRSTVIEQIRSGLKKGNSVRVISTQLIEAGVDLDFPVVYRALAGLDSIVQAAGRCNREGRPEPGQVVVFVPPSKTPPGLLSISTQTTVSLLSGFIGDIESPDTFKTYFTALFGEVKNMDKSGVLNKLQKDAESLQIQFRTAARQFRIIDDRETVSIFVHYSKKVGQWLEELARQPQRKILRKLQRYTVTIYRYQFDAMLRCGAIEEIAPGFYAQSRSGIYHDALGLQTEEPELTPYNTVI